MYTPASTAYHGTPITTRYPEVSRAVQQQIDSLPVKISTPQVQLLRIGSYLMDKSDADQYDQSAATRLLLMALDASDEPILVYTS